MRAPLHLARQEVTTADEGPGERELLGTARRSALLRNLNDAGGNDPPVGQIERAGNHLIRRDRVGKRRRIDPVPDKHEHAGPGPGPDDRVIQRPRIRRMLVVFWRLDVRRMFVVPVSLSDPVAANRRGDDVFQVREMDVVRVPRVQEIADRQRAVVAYGRKRRRQSFRSRA